MLKSMIFQITGDRRLACEGCEQRIQELLRALPGAKQVRARASDQQIGVLFETTLLKPEAIITRLAEAGYKAHPAAQVAIWRIGSDR